jgi:uncharacterized GH25 family protein
VKKLITLVVLSLCTSAPLFGAEHLLSHSAKVVADDSYKAAKFSAKAADRAGKDSFKAVKLSAKETGRAGKTFVTILF